MTARPIALSALLVLTAVGLTACGGGSKPTAQERDLGPPSTRILGGTADSKYLHVFSASISTIAPGAPRFSATLLYVGTGSDRLVRVTSPLGSATLAQGLETDVAAPISVPLRTRSATDAAAGTGSTVPVSVQLADHGTVTFTVPIVGPTPTPTPS
jgi:hypothetical protein